MATAANAVAPDRQRAELAALSVPAVAFTLAMIAFPVAYTIWLGFHAFSSTGRQTFVGLGNYSKLIADSEFWHGLWVTLALYVLSLVLQLVLGIWLALLLFHAKRLPGIVRSLFISPFRGQRNRESRAYPAAKRRLIRPCRRRQSRREFELVWQAGETTRGRAVGDPTGRFIDEPSRDRPFRLSGEANESGGESPPA